MSPGNEKRDRVIIYTDGGANPNPGPGGWGVVLIHERSGQRRELEGGETKTTNNRMELTAAIRAFEALRRPCDVVVHTDSEYVKKGITVWLPGWKKRGWRRKEGEIKNLDLWQKLAELEESHSVEWRWVRAHSGIPLNERADALARSGRKSMETKSAQGKVSVTTVSRTLLRVAKDALPLPQHTAAGETGVKAPLQTKSGDQDVVQIILSAVELGGRGAYAASVRQNGEETTLGRSSSLISVEHLLVIAATDALAIVEPGVRAVVITRSAQVRAIANRASADSGAAWSTKKGKPLKNASLWNRLGRELDLRRVEWRGPGPKLEHELSRLKKLARQLAECKP